jgi:hypothetical protein
LASLKFGMCIAPWLCGAAAPGGTEDVPPPMQSAHPPVRYRLNRAISGGTVS